MPGIPLLIIEIHDQTELINEVVAFAVAGRRTPGDRTPCSSFKREV
jgi:hypothetical protein